MRTDPALPRPAGRVTIVTVPSPSEKGGYFAPPPISPASTPPTLLWLSADALSTLTKARETGTIFKALPGVDSHPSLVQPSLEACAEFKVSAAAPKRHALSDSLRLLPTGQPRDAPRVFRYVV